MNIFVVPSGFFKGPIRMYLAFWISGTCHYWIKVPVPFLFCCCCWDTLSELNCVVIIQFPSCFSAFHFHSLLERRQNIHLFSFFKNCFEKHITKFTILTIFFMSIVYLLKNIWAIFKCTVVPPYVWFYFLQSQLPMVNCYLKILKGKFQK